MRSRFQSFFIGTLVAALGPACAAVGDAETEELDELQSTIVDEGAQLFKHETFGGNGRTCATCHPSDDGKNESGTLSPADVQEMFEKDPYGPLFQHDAADVIGGDTFNRVLTHATILINRGLPANTVLVGSDARSIVVARGIPTTMNTPALDPVLMWDGRAPNLKVQARGAIVGHSQTTNVTSEQLDAIVAFEQTLFNRNDVEDFATEGKPLTMPLGNTDSERRGRRFFIDDGLSDMGSVGESAQAVCGWCHSGNMLNEASGFFVQNIFQGIPEGARFSTALVSELNMTRLPVYTFDVTQPDGTVRRVSSPDPGLFLTTGVMAHFNLFKTPTVWGIADTAPYFHDNSSKSLEALMEHYDIALGILCNVTPGCSATVGGIDLTAQDKADIVAYMRLL